MSKTYKVASYCRVSTTGQIDNGSIQEQEAKARALCLERGYELVEVYRDEGISGSLFTERGDLQRLIRDARAGRFQFVLISAIDRLARTEMVFAQIVNELEMTLKVQVVDTLTPEFIDPDKFNPRDRGRRFIQGIKALMAQDEYLGIREKLLEGKYRAYARGKYINAHPPFGYLVVYEGSKRERNLVPDPRTYPALTTIKRLILEGHGSQEVMRRLEATGIPTVKGGHWSRTTLLGILKNPFYAGKMQVRGALYQHAYPHPWTWEEWEALQAELLRRTRRKGAVVFSRNVFSPVLRCGYCGAAMVFHRHAKKNHNFDYYMCRRWKSNTAACCPNMVPVKRLVAEVEKAVEASLTLMQKQLVRPELESALEYSHLQALSRAAKKQLEALHRRGEEIDEDYVSGFTSREEHTRLRGKYLERVAKLEAEARQLGRELEAEKARIVDSYKVNEAKSGWQGVKRWLYNPIPDWTEGQRNQFKALIKEHIASITVTNRARGKIEVEIALRYTTTNA